MSLGSTILGSSTGANCSNPEAVTSLGFNVESGASCEVDGPGDLSDADPRLGPLQDNGDPTPTHGLLAGSPAREGADPANCPAEDQRGEARPLGPGCDVGAVEAPLGPLPAVHLRLNREVFRPFQRLLLQGSLSPGPGPAAEPVDVYVVLQAGQAFFSLWPDGVLRPGLTPIVAGLAPVSANVTLLDVILPPDVPTGDFTWLTGLAEAGTSNLAGPIETVPFTITTLP